MKSLLRVGQPSRFPESQRKFPTSPLAPFLRCELRSLRHLPHLARQLQKCRRRARQFSGLSEHESHRARRAQLRHLHRDQVAARDLGQRTSSRQHRHSQAHLDGALDAIEARERDLNVDRRMSPLVHAQHAFARRRRIVVRDDGLASHLFDRDPLLRREAVPRDWRASPARRCRARSTAGPCRAAGTSGRRSRGSARAAPSRSGATRRGAPRPRACGCSRANRSMIGSSEWTAASLAPMTTRPRRTCCSSRTAASASAANRSRRWRAPGAGPRLGQRPVARRPIEELVAELVLEAPDRLADGRLRAVQLLRRLRKAAIGGDRNECVQVLQLHSSIISNNNRKSKTINWTNRAPAGYYCQRRT